MSKHEVYKCDACGKTEPPYRLAPNIFDVPVGWLTVTWFPNDDTKNRVYTSSRKSVDVCSTECLREKFV